MKLNNRGNWTLIGLLAAVAIVAILAAVYLVGGDSGGTVTVKKDSKLLDSKSTKKTIVGRSIDTGKAADCQQRIHQIRLGIDTYRSSSASETNPSSFKDIGLGVSNDYFKCPVSEEAYRYDPATGTVQCPTHTQY